MAVAGRDPAAVMGITYEKFLEGYSSASMTKRLNTVEEIAAMATLLAGDAGAGITGAS